MQQAPWTLPHILVQVVRRGHRGKRGVVVVRVTKTPIATAQVMAVMIVVLKEFLFVGGEIVKRLLLESTS